MTYAVTISGNNISFSMETVSYAVSLSQSGLQGLKGDKGDKGDTGSNLNNITGARIGAAIAAQPLYGEASLLALYADQAYAIGDRSGLTAAKTFSEVFDFSRSTIRTGFDPAGDLATFAVNAPRFVYGVGGSREGLAVGPQITNNVEHSSDITNAAWVKLGATVSGTRVTEDTSTGTHLIHPPADNFTAGQSYVFYADVGPNRDRSVRLGLPAAAFTSFGFCEIAPNGTVTTGGAQAGKVHGAIPLPDGNVRIWVSATADATASASGLLVMFNGASNNYTGDGTSGFDLYRFQLATGVYPGDFVETAASPVTHEPDLLEVKPAVVADVLNATEGTLVIEFDAYVLAISSFLMAIHNTSDNRIQLTVGTDSAIGFAVVRDSVVTEPGNIIGTLVEGETTKIAIRYSATEVTACVDGGAVDTSVVAAPIGMNQIHLFSNVAGSGNAAGRLKTFTIIPRALSDAELQAITS